MWYDSSLMLSKMLGPYFVVTRSFLMVGYFVLLHPVDFNRMTRSGRLKFLMAIHLEVVPEIERKK
jgi:hypothetical protein